MKRAIYPGTFDPVTNGHLDILFRACKIFDEVIIAVASNEEKRPFFTVEERVKLIEANLTPESNVRVLAFDNLLVDFAKKIEASAIVRGLRAVSDFEFEFQMTQMNRHLDDSIETIFLMPNQENFFTSSGIIKQVATYGGHIEKLVPENVHLALKKRFE